MAAEVEEVTTPGSAATGEEVKPYRIHVSSRYLELTRQKLEVTRLPHESSEPRSQDWWEPKAEVEELVDFWLEQYSWRAEEARLNTLPQFRTAISVASLAAPIKTHFIHIRSPHAKAIPLLLIPPFPFSNLSFGHLAKPLTDPDDAANNQPFHLVIPSLPGLGFGDRLPNNTAVISSTTELFNSLMIRLSYSYYLVTNAGPGATSPAEIDYQIANRLSTRYSDSCLGTHLISPPIVQPRLRESPIGWAKWSIARTLKTAILGYNTEDFTALERNGYVGPSKKSTKPVPSGLNQLGCQEPNTLAYALCDSPTGLMVFVMRNLRLLGPEKEFTPAEVINFAQLAWLPGPESALRFWAHCLRHQEKVEKKKGPRPKVAITVFLGDEPEAPQGEVKNAGKAMPRQDEGRNHYICPTWANPQYHVVHTHRASGKSGLLAWERSEVIAAGVRGLAAAVMRLDSRLRPATESTVAPLEQVVAEGHRNEPTPAASARPTPTLSAPPKIREPGHPQRQISDDTAVGSDENLTQKTPFPVHPTSSPVHLAPPASAGMQHHRETSDDTIVEQPEEESR